MLPLIVCGRLISRDWTRFLFMFWLCVLSFIDRPFHSTQKGKRRTITWGKPSMQCCFLHLCWAASSHPHPNKYLFLWCSDAGKILWWWFCQAYAEPAPASMTAWRLICGRSDTLHLCGEKNKSVMCLESRVRGTPPASRWHCFQRWWYSISRLKEKDAAVSRNVRLHLKPLKGCNTAGMWVLL